MERIADKKPKDLLIGSNIKNWQKAIFMETVVSIDEFGRLLVPKAIRRLFSARKFALQFEEDEIKLTPLKTWDEFFGSSPELNVRRLEKLRREEEESG